MYDDKMAFNSQSQITPWIWRVAGKWKIVYTKSNYSSDPSCHPRLKS